MGLVRLPSYRGCFGCGKDNPFGLKLEIFWNEKERCTVCDLKLDERYQGFEGVIHGGIVSTVCDELLWWCITASLKKCTVTAEMTVKYKRPVKSNERYRATARVVSAKGRRIEAVCRIEEEGGATAAEARGVFIALPQEAWEDFLRGIEDADFFKD